MNYVNPAHESNVMKTRFFCRKIDNCEIPVNKNEIRLFVVARDESLRLPFFFKYYFKKLVDRIFLIDNGSTDDTVELSLQYTNVHVFQILQNYKDHWNWIEYMLMTYGTHHWCLVVDVDELVYYPYAESVSLKRLIHFLDARKYTAMRFLLLEMYSDKSIVETTYKQDQNPLEVCQYFDPEFEVCNVTLFDKMKWKFFETIVYKGGMRDRVFGVSVPQNLKKYERLPYFLSKVSLFWNDGHTYLTQGMHALNSSSFTDLHGVVFHTKYLYDFINEVKEESNREEHFDDAIMYKIFDSKIKRHEKLCLKYPGSIKFLNSDQLIELGIMKSSIDFDEFTMFRKE